MGIADDSASDVITDENGNEIVDHEHISRSRLRVDARNWVASKLLPKVYGEKLQHTGEGGGPVRVRPDLSKLTDEELSTLERIVARAEGTR